jgi:hypothetical protein
LNVEEVFHPRFGEAEAFGDGFEAVDDETVPRVDIWCFTR